MSVPATNALPPAPRRTITRTSSSASTRSQHATSSSYIANVIALCASGRLNVTQAVLPRDLVVDAHPSSARISSLCSPSSGAGRRIEPGVALSLIGMPSPYTVPASGCSISTTISRASVCGSLTTCA